jgi:hypothetical protein
MSGACAGQTKEGLGPELCSVRVLVSGLVRESRALWITTRTVKM